MENISFFDNEIDKKIVKNSSHKGNINKHNSKIKTKVKSKLNSTKFDYTNICSKEVYDRFITLKDEIEKHNKLYYEEDASIISDYDYDKLTVEYRKILDEYPALSEMDTYTKNIGGKTKSSFEDVKHEIQMQSLQDVFDLEDVEKFVSSLKESDENIEFVVETKIDGLSISLEYVDGILVRASTRGDGFVGEDVTENIKCIKSIPHKLPTKDTIEVRGEVYLSRKNLELLNKEMEMLGKKQFANARNTAAGTLRQLDTDLVKSRNLDIFIFNVQKTSSKEFSKHSESLDYLKSLGLHTIEYCRVCKTVAEVISSINEIGSLRESFEYDIDGAVVKVNDLKLREKLGSTIKVPKWAVAYKYPPEQKETKILDIIVQVGRTGKVTPMAVLKPVKVAGSVISSVTLHNFDYINLKDIKIGDTCIIQKAGDVIPEIDRVLPDKRDGSEKIFIKPTICPVCGEKLEELEDIVDIRCTNSECPALIYRSIIHFTSRDCMDISGLGESIVNKLILNDKIKDIADIYYLTYEDIFNLDNFKDKSTTNLLNAIEKSKSNSLDKLLFGLGIRNIGKKATKVLSGKFEDIYAIKNASVEEFEEIEDFGKVMALSVKEFFNKEATDIIIKKLNKVGVNLKGNKVILNSNILEGLNICVTGSFDNYSRNDIAEIIEKNGGKNVSSVSKKTNYLIAGEDSGSKFTKAESLGISIITIDEFLKMI